jgi:hypothetical protein
MWSKRLGVGGQSPKKRPPRPPAAAASTDRTARPLVTYDLTRVCPNTETFFLVGDLAMGL